MPVGQREQHLQVPDAKDVSIGDRSFTSPRCCSGKGSGNSIDRGSGTVCLLVKVSPLASRSERLRGIVKALSHSVRMEMERHRSFACASTRRIYLKKTDAWAPRRNKLVLTNDCQYWLNTNCTIIQKIGQCNSHSFCCSPPNALGEAAALLGIPRSALQGTRMPTEPGRRPEFRESSQVRVLSAGDWARTCS